MPINSEAVSVVEMEGENHPTFGVPFMRDFEPLVLLVSMQDASEVDHVVWDFASVKPMDVKNYVDEHLTTHPLADYSLENVSVEHVVRENDYFTNSVVRH